MHSTSTHIWERITTVSSWNAIAVTSPMSRPRKRAAKKVTTHITCNETVDGNIIRTVQNLGHVLRVGAGLDLKFGPGCPSALGEVFFLVKQGQSHQPEHKRVLLGATISKQ